MKDLDAFLRWNSGHLLENRTCGAYAEWLVHWASIPANTAYAFCLLAEQDPEVVAHRTSASGSSGWCPPAGCIPNANRLACNR